MANLIINTNNKTIITYKFLLILTLMCLLVPYYYVAKINIILTVFFSLILFYKTKAINDFKLTERSSENRKPWIDRIIKHRYTLFLSILLILGFIVRVINLTALPPYTDEYVHLLFAREINDDNYERHYLRAYFLTYLVSIIFKIFGESLFNARLPGIIISTLTIIPMYFIGKKIANKHVGILTATLGYYDFT
jgi:4-amino-4-deoxy-L-arabinose transferase-like glycosyltransferase